MQTLRQKRAFSLARQRLRQMDPHVIAHRAGVSFHSSAKGSAEGVFQLLFLNNEFQVTYPEGEIVVSSGTPTFPSLTLQLLSLHYLVHADGSRMADRWVAFRELPHGLVYERAFRARVEPPLLRTYSTQLDLFEKAARAIGGTPISFGDCAFMFSVFPRIRMAIIFYLGDEELPPAVRVLFDGAAGHYLPTEDLAILGGVLLGSLLKATPKGE